MLWTQAPSLTHSPLSQSHSHFPVYTPNLMAWLLRSSTFVPPVSRPTTVPQESSVPEGCRPFLKWRRTRASNEMGDNAMSSLCCFLLKNNFWFILCYECFACTYVCAHVCWWRRRSEEGMGSSAGELDGGEPSLTLNCHWSCKAAHKPQSQASCVLPPLWFLISQQSLLLSNMEGLPVVTKSDHICRTYTK